ncbi:MAG: helix-turn-helix transcriptional regulator [Alphaproteobacteria bacterium]|nr:helix-turn-helix transcriptional regulator [Alphaproteobacteria bacterium]
MTTIGTRIRQAREAKGMTQEQLGKRVGPVTREAVSLWESDGARPRDARLERIAAVLDVDYDWLRTAPADENDPRDLTMAFDADLLRRTLHNAFSLGLHLDGPERFIDAAVKGYRHTYSTRELRRKAKP